MHAALLTAIAIALVTVSFSNQFLPRLESRCGRLVRVPSGFDSLAMNSVRLDVRGGAHWRTVDARYRLEDEEALSFVIDRRIAGGEAAEQVGGDYLVVRISRVPALPSGILIFSGDVLQSRDPMPLAGAGAEISGEVSFERRADGVYLTVLGGGTVKLPVSAAPGEFEVALFPPGSVELHDRIELGRVELSDGAPLEPHRFHDLLRWAWLQGALVVGLAVACWGWLGRLPARWFPFQADRSPSAITVWLLCVLATVVLLALIPRHQLLHSFSVKGQVVFRLVLALMVGGCFAFMRIRERFLVRFPRVARNRSMHPALLPLQVVAMVSSLALVVVAVGSLQVRFEPATELERTERASRIRIAVVGGSQTRGYPFPEGWTGAFPERLEQLLRARGVASVSVWNLGVDAAGLDHIREHLPERIAALAPTHLIVNSVVNSAPMGMAEVYRTALESFLAVARPLVRTIVFVEEPDLEPIYQAGRWPSVSPLYPVLEDVARRHGLAVIDPIPILAAHREEFLFMDDVHFTAHGHRVMAEVLADALEREQAGLQIGLAGDAARDQLPIGSTPLAP